MSENHTPPVENYQSFLNDYHGRFVQNAIKLCHKFPQLTPNDQGINVPISVLYEQLFHTLTASPPTDPSWLDVPFNALEKLGVPLGVIFPPLFSIMTRDFTTHLSREPGFIFTLHELLARMTLCLTLIEHREEALAELVKAEDESQAAQKGVDADPAGDLTTDSGVDQSEIILSLLSIHLEAEIKLITLYKGVSLAKLATLHAIENGHLVIEISEGPTMPLEMYQSVILRATFLGRPVRAKIISLGIKPHYVHLANLEWVEGSVWARKSPRIQPRQKLWATISSEYHTHEGSIFDLSMSGVGLALATSCQLQSKERVNIELMIPDQEGSDKEENGVLSLTVKAEVLNVYSQEQSSRIGLKIFPTPDVAAHLWQYLHHQQHQVMDELQGESSSPGYSNKPTANDSKPALHSSKTTTQSTLIMALGILSGLITIGIIIILFQHQVSNTKSGWDIAQEWWTQGHQCGQLAELYAQDQNPQTWEKLQRCETTLRQMKERNQRQ